MNVHGAVAIPRFNPFDRQFRADPYPTYRALREHDAIHRSMGMWVITSYADVVAVLRDSRFASGLIPEQIERQAQRLGFEEYKAFLRLGLQSIVFTDPPEHTRLRRLVATAFSPPRLPSFDLVIAEVVSSLLRQLPRDAEFDAISSIAEQVPLTVMCRKLGIESAMATTIGRWTHEIRYLLEPGLLKRSDFQSVKATLNDYTAFLHGVIAERRCRPGEDLISELLAARLSGDMLTDEELAHACMMVFIAGNETTKALIGNALAALVDHPDECARLRASPELIDNAVLEVLRWNSPLQHTKRIAREAASIGGRAISAGDTVLLCLGAANRDPTRFSEPDRFDIGRNTTGQLGLGFGLHACLGGRVAIREAIVTLRSLVSCSQAIQAGIEPRSLQETELIVRGYARLPIVLRT
jgi:cytochrome P450